MYIFDLNAASMKEAKKNTLLFLTLEDLFILHLKRELLL